MVLITKVALAKAGTKSIKSTVPEGIVEFLELKDKDELEWSMETRNKQRVTVIQKKKSIKKEYLIEDPIEELAKMEQNKKGD